MNSIQPLSNPRKLFCEHRHTNSEVYIETLKSQHHTEGAKGSEERKTIWLQG